MFFGNFRNRMKTRAMKKEAERLLNEFKYQEARARAIDAVDSCGDHSDNILRGRCNALVAEVIRREHSGPFGVVVDREKIQEAVPFYIQAWTLLAKELGWTREVRTQAFYMAFILSQVEQFDSARPVWEVLMNDSEYSNMARWRYGQALARGGYKRKAIDVLRSQVEFEKNELKSASLNDVRASDMLWLDYLRGAFELAPLLIEERQFDEAEALIRWILEFSERPGENLDRTFDPAHDRTLKLLAECLWAKRKCDEAWKIQLRRLSLLRNVAKSTEARDHLDKTLKCIDRFYHERGKQSPLFDVIFTEIGDGLDASQRCSVAVRHATSLAKAERFEEALIVIRTARKASPSTELDMLELTILVRAGLFTEAEVLASRCLG